MGIALIDYGAGNLTSVRKALGALGAEVITPAGPGELGSARGVIVPGVGHFGATRRLDGPWRAALLDAVHAGRPLLGICLGMQWLYEGSDEEPGLAGLGLIPGRSARLAGGAGLKVPHVGWNNLAVRRPSILLDGVPHGSFVYFAHSFAAPVTDAAIATTMHGERFASAVERGRVFGVQFHPEKSGEVGLRILRNFLSALR